MSRFLPTLSVSLLLAVGVMAERVENREVTPRTTLRMIAFAEEAETIVNPLSWPQLVYVIPDGTYVEKGRVITEFDAEGIETGLEELRRDREVTQANLDRKLIELRNRDLSLRDQLAELRDRLAVLETQLIRYRALPDADDVAIAEGRLKVAELELTAAKKDFEKAKDRLARGMISPAELDNFDRAYQERKARHDYRTAMLDLTQEPASESTLRKTELKIANLNLEVERFEHQIAENEEISAIEKRGASARLEIVDNRIAERESDLSKTSITAPIAGHVMYLPMFRRYAGRTGEKMWKNFNFMRIPNPDKLAFKGAVLESERRFFAEGDCVFLRTVGRPELPVEGRIASFSRLSRDRAEKEQSGWGGDGESGIMVYDITVKVDDPPEWFRIGTTAECELVASTPVAGPSVPASFVKTRDHETYLAVDGIYRTVEGTMVNAFFVLDDDSLTGQEVALVGRFADEGDASAGEADPSAFRVSGELLPANTEDVTVQRIHRWQKIAWLIPEDTEVNEGDVVARLDTADTDEEIREQTSELKQAVSRRETEEEETKLKMRENEFDLARERNLLQVAEIDLETVQKGIDSAAYLSSRQSTELAGIRLAYLKKRLERTENSRLTALSPLEIAKLRRDHKRAELEFEASRIRLAKIARGADRAAQSQAELDYLERKLRVATLEKKVETDVSRSNYQVRHLQGHERRERERLEELQQFRENLVIRAPRKGLVQYNKIWNSGVFSKVNVGSMVGYRFAVMQIADVSSMYIRLEIPERLFTRVIEGMPVDVRIPSLAESALTGTVSEVEFLFEPKRKKDTDRGLYSSHETLGQTVFYVRVQVDEQQGVKLKPGAVADVVFPFGD